MSEFDFNYELFIDLSPDLICIAGYDGYFKKINSAVSEVLGYSKEELYAKPINHFVYQDDKEITNIARDDLRDANTLRNFENRYVTKDGDIIWLSWTSQPVESQELIFAIAKEVTHKKRLENERLKLIKQLTQVNEDLKQFSLTTSHDLRSPLTGLQSVFELMDYSKINDRDTLELMEILKQTGENLKESLDDYVDSLSQKFSKQNKVEEINLEETLNAVLQSISSLIESSEATVQTDFTDFQKVKFNQSYMESVFLNLITNSIRYSKPDCSPEISIHTEESEGVQRMIVSDSGLGFDMEKVDGNLFKMNETFHDNEDSKGVGLYLVHRHVTSLGGNIEVESEVGEGTTFIIEFA